MKTTALLTNDQLRQMVIAGKGKQTLTAYAAKLGVSFQFLAKVLSGDYQPGPTIAKNMGYEQVITYTFRKAAKPTRKVPEKIKPRPVRKGWPRKK